MKHSYKLIVPMLFLICSCRSTSENKEQPISEEQENVIVDSLTSQLDAAGQDLEAITEESLNEIDSILQDIETEE